MIYMPFLSSGTHTQRILQMDSVAARITNLEAHLETILAELKSLKLETSSQPIPMSIARPSSHNPLVLNKELYVLWDTETNGLGRTDKLRICQIGAVALDQNMNEVGFFNEFVNPLVDIDPRATVVNGIDLDFVSMKDSWNIVGQKFNNWIEMHRGKNGIVNLVAHNGKRFDARILTFEHARHNIDLPRELYHTDSIPVFKELFPNLSNYKLGTIYEDTFKEPIPDQHTALQDCRAMQRLLGTASEKLVRDKLFKYRESFDCVVKRCMKTH